MIIENKTVIGLQEVREEGRFAGLEDVEIYEHSPELFMEMLNDGPCQVMFNRVYSGGIRTMRCIKPEFPSAQNAFAPRFPNLIAVIDLDKGDWRSFYYDQVLSFRRIRKGSLNYQQRKIASILRGEDWDYLYPGPEGPSLRGNEHFETFSKFRDEFIIKPLLRQKSRMSN